MQVSKVGAPEVRLEYRVVLSLNGNHDHILDRFATLAEFVVNSCAMRWCFEITRNPAVGQNNRTRSSGLTTELYSIVASGLCIEHRRKLCRLYTRVCLDWTLQSAASTAINRFGTWNNNCSPKCKCSTSQYPTSSRSTSTLSMCIPHFSVPSMMRNNRCISSTALSANDEGLSLCSSALRNLSTAPAPRSLSGERAAACFTSLQRLLCRCPDHRQIRVDCAASMVNFVDASHVHDLQVMRFASFIFTAKGCSPTICVSDNH